MKITGIEFPELLCTALRDGKLIVFAGAGVSMGDPANLPNFHHLACMIAEDTGQTLQNSEPVDRFLGRLKHQRVDVHTRAAQALSQGDPQPTELHRDLLRLCSTAGQVRIVTTNFDLLFERAVKDVLDFRPEIFPGACIAPRTKLQWHRTRSWCGQPYRRNGAHGPGFWPSVFDRRMGPTFSY